MNAAATPPNMYPREGGSPVYGLPMKNEGPSDFFPAVCLQSHWDPTAVIRRTLPTEYVAQPMDPRPWTKICMEYTTSGVQEAAPAVDPNAVLPTGGQFYPPSRYASAIDNESRLRRLDRPLGTCEKDQWEPTVDSDMYTSKALLPSPETRKFGISDRIQDVAYPKALLRSGPYDCRQQQDIANMKMSSEYVFNNPTKQDKYKKMKKPFRAAPPEQTLQGSVATLRPDLDFSAVQPETQKMVFNRETRQFERAKVGGSYGGAAAVARADLVANAVESPGPAQRR